ncbi:MAG: hypothetical protein FD148_84 [Methylocystaceae bacterium]|nr:MAG: hypothetical protein FD148_84 [Methylocystaceae bacterium]
MRPRRELASSPSRPLILYSRSPGRLGFRKGFSPEGRLEARSLAPDRRERTAKELGAQRPRLSHT